MIAIISVCAALTVPCTPARADTVLIMPFASVLPSTCFMQAQAYLAGSSIERRPDDQVAIRCVRAGR